LNCRSNDRLDARRPVYVDGILTAVLPFGGHQRTQTGNVIAMEEASPKNWYLKPAARGVLNSSMAMAPSSKP